MLSVVSGQLSSMSADAGDMQLSDFSSGDDVGELLGSDGSATVRVCDDVDVIQAAAHCSLPTCAVLRL